MPENKRLRYDKPKATVCKGAASGPLRPLPKVSNLVKTFNKKAIIKSGEAGGKRRGVQKERGFIGGRLWEGFCQACPIQNQLSPDSHTM